jgi:hypothetical protein
MAIECQIVSNCSIHCWTETGERWRSCDCKTIEIFSVCLDNDQTMVFVYQSDSNIELCKQSLPTTDAFISNGA